MGTEVERIITVSLAVIGRITPGRIAAVLHGRQDFSLSGELQVRKERMC
ncbi:hypothetical protein [Selenomonas ruminantium]|nr:hypothetical protein [Selenomonas ruminantium]